MEFLLATRNKNKVHEIIEYLKSLTLVVRSLQDFPDAPQVREDGSTFEQNAVKKAVECASYTGLLTLADDSGLAVDALDGAPGVRSARYAGENATDFRNNMKLLEEMKDVGSGGRTATFICCMALADRNGLIRTVTGKCEGEILTAPRGQGGFGYDPLFVKHDYNRTFAELPLELKNRVSHRAMALEKAYLAIEGYLMSLREEKS
jgi:XTP/dITP diphosphohydrolase